VVGHERTTCHSQTPMINACSLRGYRVAQYIKTIGS
jgi:hypothetical protein